MPFYPVNADDPKFNLLLFGDPGSGKTTLAASAQDSPSMKDVIFVNIEGGLISVAHRGDIMAEDISTVAELEKLFWRLAQKDKDYDRFNTVVIDSGSELQSLSIEEIVSAAINRVDNPRKSTMDDVYLEDWGRSTVQLRRILRYFKSLPHNIIVTSLAKYFYPGGKDPKAGAGADPVAVIPAMTSKLAKSVMGYMDMVWYTYLDQDTKEFRVLTQQHGAYYAKTRGPNFLRAIGQTFCTGQPVDPKTEVWTLAKVYDTFVKTEQPIIKEKVK